MSAGIAGLIALGGVVLGFVLGLIRDRIERKHKEQTRWHDVRRAAYVAFLHAADAVWREGHKMPYEWKARLDSPDPESRHEAWTELNRYRDELAAHHREIQLVASQAVIEAADEVTNRVSNIASTVGATVTDPTSVDAVDRVTQAWLQAVVAAERFKDEARGELGIAPSAAREDPRRLRRRPRLPLRRPADARRSPASGA